MRDRLREIARQTVAAVEARRYEHPMAGTVKVPGVAQAVAGTKLYLPEAELRVEGDPNGSPAIEVTGESILEAARRAGPGAAALVFASARNPGGGFLNGA